MQTNVNPVATVVPKVASGTGTSAAAITLAAAEGVRHVLDKVWASYNDNPGAVKSLLITCTVNGVAIVLTYYIPAGETVVLDFNPPIQADENTAMTIILEAGGGTITGTVCALTR